MWEMVGRGDAYLVAINPPLMDTKVWDFEDWPLKAKSRGIGGLEGERGVGLSGPAATKELPR